MVRRVFCAICLAGSATGVQAAGHEVAEFIPVLHACYAAAEGGEKLRTCRGRMSETCMQTSDEGYSTLGMVTCLSAETAVWDRYLDSEYRVTMAWARAADADEAERFPEFANRAEALRAAQHAWIAFRDAECGLAHARWGSGSMRTIAAAGCRLDMTAARTIDLHSMREPFQ